MSPRASSICPTRRTRVTLGSSAAGHPSVGARRPVDDPAVRADLMMRADPVADGFDICQYRIMSIPPTLLRAPGRDAIDEAACVPLARMFKALGDPVRLRLLSLIASHAGAEACVCDISGTFELSQPTISHHLKVLRSAGILDCERRGSWVYYRVIPAALQRLSATLQTQGGTATPSDRCTEETRR